MPVASAGTATFDLSGHTAMVTGCSRGIGRTITLALAEAGADIVGLGTSLRPGSDIESDVVACGRRFWPVTADFRDRQQVLDATTTIASTCPPIDILVNNAGIVVWSPAAEHAMDDWDSVVDVNLSSAFLLTRDIGQRMLARGAGRIVFISSVLGVTGGRGVASYVASKSAVIGLVRALANEWGQGGINVNAIAPGYVPTELNRDLHEDAERYEAIRSRIPAGRWGHPDDIAGPVLFLCSQAAAYVNGIVLAVDGGWLGT